MKLGPRYEALPNLTAPFADHDPLGMNMIAVGKLTYAFEVKENHNLMVEAIYRQARLIHCL